MAQLPRGTVTFLFTDVESSTRLWAEHPEAMPVANARHETILRDAIARHGGFLYKITGDSLQAAFATVPAGLAAAYEAQHALIVEPWHESGLPEPLRTRIVLHVAAVDPEEDGYRSPSLNRLGRLLDAAHGGQVLLSAAAQALVWESLPAGTALRDLGQHRLKDLTQPSRIYQLLAAALPEDFPPLRTLERYRNNLPLQPTIFLGREQEIATVTRMLRVPEARLLSLTGPGGTGKTRLSLAVSSELLDDFPAGVWFIDLSAIRDASLVPSAIAQALGIREEPARPILATLRDAMREWKLLLVLDNFEHVLAAAPVVADLLASAPEIKVLVTSREPLHLRGEREFPVPTFGVPDPREPVSLARLTQYEAVRLFISRAQDVKPDFTVDSENAPAVAEICHRLDGLPLAIELAAARIKLLPVEALRRRLEQRLAVLTSATRDVPERQRTLKAAIDWSHDLINPEEQTLFRRVAVFSNGFTLEAVDAVATDEVVLDSLTGIASLVDKSLLRQGEGSDGEPRFSLLTTIREYARERLDATAEVDEIRRRHAGWFLTRATEAVPHLTGPAPAPWLDRLEIEHDNLRAALHWALAPGGDPELGLRLATALSRFWFIRGHLFEGRRWLDQALAADQAVAPDVRAAAVQGAASLAWGQGDTARAGALYEEALQLATDGKDTVGVATALSSLGLVAQDAHQFDRARDYFQRAVAAFREGKETQRLAATLLNLGTLYYAQEDLARAEAALAESLALAREVGNTRTAALCLLNLGAVATDRDELDPAEELLNEALGLFRSIGDKRAIASCLSNMGDLAHERGDRPAAAALLAEALALFQAVGDRRGIAGCLDSIARMLGPSDEAVRLFAAASEYVSHTGGTDTASVARDGDAIVSAVRLALGEPAFAAAWANGSRLSLEEAVATALAAAANVENERLASTSALC